MGHGTENRNRKERTKIWISWYEKHFSKKPTNDEGRAFANGFANGWDARLKHEKKLGKLTQLTGDSK